MFMDALKSLLYQRGAGPCPHALMFDRYKEVLLGHCVTCGEVWISEDDLRIWIPLVEGDGLCALSQAPDEDIDLPSPYPGALPLWGA